MTKYSAGSGGFSPSLDSMLSVLPKTEFESVLSDESISASLRESSQKSPDRVYASFGTQMITHKAFYALVRQTAAMLTRSGISSSSCVAVGSRNSIAHSAIIFAVFEIGATWIPINVRLRGKPLEHIFHDCPITHFVAETSDNVFSSSASACKAVTGTELEDVGTLAAIGTGFEAFGVWKFHREGAKVPLNDDIRAIVYTSGTTGPAKGVLVTDKMLRAAACGAIEAAGPFLPGDVLHVWEPFCHIGGIQVLLLPLFSEARLALVDGFSASTFWQEIVETGATHIHHLGGILQILLRQPVHPLETAHSIRVSWGGGATPSVQLEAEERFGFPVHECYGMTEASSIMTVNRKGQRYGVGFPLPWFEIRIDSDEGTKLGEIVVRGRYAGLITPGYYNSPGETNQGITDEWWSTGDLGEFGDEGQLHFHGRANDSVRVRGENVSSWEVESLFNTHSSIRQSAVVSVPAEVGEHEMVLLFTVEDGHEIKIPELVEWASEYLPSFQIPRYFQTVSGFPMTPSHRVAKKELDVDLSSAFDRRAKRDNLTKSHFVG